MTKTDKDISLEHLDALLDQARETQVPDPSADFLARVLSDAQEVQDGFAPALPERQPRPGLWAQLLGAIGGWPAMGGLVTATVTGVWIGVSPPQSLSDTVTPYLEGAGLATSSDYVLDPFDGFGLDVTTEG